MARHADRCAALAQRMIWIRIRIGNGNGNGNGNEVGYRNVIKLRLKNSPLSTFNFQLFAFLIFSSGLGGQEIDVLFDAQGPRGDDASTWSTFRDRDRLAAEFSLSELAVSRDPPALRWRFVSRGVPFNDIFLQRPIERPFEKIRVRLRNDGPPFELCAKTRDAKGAEWTAQRVPLERGGDFRWVEFPAAQWRPASWSRDPDGVLDFPLAWFTLIAFEVRPGEEYRLLVERVEVVRPEPPSAVVERIMLPERLRAGETVAARFWFTLDRPCREADAYLAFLRDGSEYFRAGLRLPAPLPELPSGAAQEAAADIRVPLHAFGGPHQVALHLGNARIRPVAGAPDGAIATVAIDARTAGKSVAKVADHRGAPALFVNGEPLSGMAWATYTPSAEVFGDFTRAGVGLFTFSATPTEAGYGLSRTAWKAPGVYDFSQLDQRALMVLEANPKAYFFPRLYLHAPRWWSEGHPDDVVRLDPGDGKPVPFIHQGGLPAPSWASDAWRRDTAEGLRRLIEHVASSPYADRVIGYHLASGTTEEWMMWGANENEWVDYSPVNTRKFREWLREKYRTDEGLRAAWGDPAASLDSASVPSRKMREASGPGSLHDPAREQAVIDYSLYSSDLTADTIAFFARAVKDLTRGEKIVGCFYGYLLQLCGEQRQENAGHLALGRLLSSPDIDFVASPTSYAFRQVGGEGTSHFMSLLGSVKLHGKLWFNENDVRTSISGGKEGEWGRPTDLAGDLLQEDKELANALVNGAAQWWFDVGGNRYNHPDLMARIGALAAAASRALEVDRSPVDEAALVVDERSIACLRSGDPWGAWLLLAQLPALHRLGAPVGHYLSTDIPLLASRKLLFIPLSLAPSDADRRAIDSLKGGGRVLVFFWMDGAFRAGKIEAPAMSDLSGIRVRLSTEPAPLRATVRGEPALTEGLSGTVYGPGSVVSPLAIADDPEATVLASFPDGRPALVMKPMAGWTAIHAAVPLLPAGLLRRIARLAGVHLYIESEDVVWASRDLVGISVKDAGPRTVRLSRKARVSDLITGAPVSEAADSFPCDFAARQTRVFVLR
jgi:glycosyl hydrolase family 42 (putative beta-galactosidase)